MSLKKFKRMSKHGEERIIFSNDLLNFIKFSLFLIEKRSCFIDRYLNGLFVDIFCDFIGLVEEKILILDCSWEHFFSKIYGIADASGMISAWFQKMSVNTLCSK